LISSPDLNLFDYLINISIFDFLEDAIIETINGIPNSQAINPPLNVVFSNILHINNQEFVHK